MPTAHHRLVAIGDSLTQGFMSGAIHRTDLAYPVWVADALGTRCQFRVADFSGAGGLPINLERLLAKLGETVGNRLDWWDVLPAAARARAILDDVEDYWERGRGMLPLPEGTVHHNLAVWGFEVGDALQLTEGICRAALRGARDDLLKQIPEMPMYRTARRVLNPTCSPLAAERTQLRCAKTLAADGGIENLVVALGANNALGTVTSLEIHESTAADLERPAHERKCNLYLPEHFATLYARLGDAVDGIGAQRVFVGTVPHVTIAPVTRGVSPGGSHLVDGYFEYYTRPWIWDDEFDPQKHDRLTRAEARRIDGFVDAYNETIRREAQQRGWHVFDLCRLLDDLADRRNLGQPKLVWPPGLVAALRADAALSYLVDDGGRVLLDSRFLWGDAEHPGRLKKGGVFSLDGIHPTTIGYGLAADALLTAMKLAKAAPAAAEIDWPALVAADTLVHRPPGLLDDLQKCLRFVEKHGGLREVLGEW